MPSLVRLLIVVIAVVIVAVAIPNASSTARVGLLFVLILAGNLGYYFATKKRSV